MHTKPVRNAIEIALNDEPYMWKEVRFITRIQCILFAKGVACKCVVREHSHQFVVFNMMSEKQITIN